MKQVLGPKFVKKANQWVITILYSGKERKQENRFFNTEQEAEIEIAKEKQNV
jgi:hypothetical protein